MLSIETLVIDAPAGPLHATRWGTGEPRAVLLHAGVTDRRGFADVATRQTGGTLLAYDRRGFGDTAPAEVDAVDDLNAVLDAVTTGPVWLVGSSQGGAVALHAALRTPERVRGLVLLSPAVPGAPAGDWDADTVQLDAAADTARAAGDVEAAVVFETHLWLDGPAQPEGRVQGPARQLAAEMNRIVVAHEIAGQPMPGPGEIWSHLGAITVPTVVAAGEYDVPVVLQRARAAAERLPAGRFVSLPGTAHLPYLDDPSAVAALLGQTVG